MTARAVALPVVVAATLAVLLAAAAGLTACGPRTVPATGLLVVVDTDLAVPDELDSIAFSVQSLPADDGGAPPDATVVGPVPVADVAGRPWTLGVAQSSAAQEAVTIVVSGRRGVAEVVRRAVRVAFVRGETRAVPLLLARRCGGVVCGADETCTETVGCRRVDVPRPEDSAPVAAYCAPGTADCDGDLGQETSNGCETDVRVSTAHCGRCGRACPGGDACTAGTCASEAVVDVAAGGAHTCAVRASGALFCWGLNVNGQLGVGAVASVPVSSPVAVRAPAGLAAVAELVAGRDHTCARTARGGAVYCWGLNTSGQCGVANTGAGAMPMATAPVPIGAAGVTLPPFAQLALGEAHTCARAQEGAGRVFCWGSDTFGQLGNGTMMGSSARPAEVPMLTDATALTAGDRFNCATRMGMQAQCWGQNNRGQLGTNNTATQQSPTNVAGPMLTAAELSAGQTHTCARAASGATFCWGADELGQLGDGMAGPDPRLAPDASRRVLGGDYAAVATGEDFACGLRTGGGAVLCWGSNRYGQLGRGGAVDGASHPTPADVVGLRDVARVATGAGHACAVRRWGGILCWGDNASGQLGDGTLTGRTRPVFVNGMP